MTHMPHVDAQGKTLRDFMSHAVRIAYANGYCCIPVDAGSKKPAAGHGWQNKRHRLHELEAYVQQGCNIGILFGTPGRFGRKLVFVDVDCVNPETSRKILHSQ